MFGIGWPEIICILLLGLIIIGPERLPGVIKDVQAALYAARKAINNAKAELNGEFSDLGADLEEFRQPLSQIARIQRMGPKAAITRALFDDDEDFLDSFDPRKIMKGDTAGEAYRRQAHQQDLRGQEPRPQRDRETPPTQRHDGPGPAASSGGFSWDDVT